MNKRIHPINLSQRLYPDQHSRVLALIQQIARDAYNSGVADSRANTIDVVGPSLTAFWPELRELGLALPQQQLPQPQQLAEADE
jgi:hypothetical protein